MTSGVDTGSASVDLVFISGWGHQSAVWQPLAGLLAEHHRVHMVELPGYGSSTDCSVEGDWQLENLLPGLRKRVPENAVCCGWSLGGMIATALAAEYPGRIKALVTLCSNPKFVQSKDWSDAMARETFEQFESSLALSPQETLSRFRALATAGSENPRGDLRELRQLLSGQAAIEETALVESLRLLKQLDVTPQMAALDIPQLHILGGEDALVPKAVRNRLLKLNPGAQVEVIETSGHVPQISHPRECSALIEEFLAP